uniref:Uncharacterized protein n=1 Tax=Caenorhabditis tropicalis TaxID=1561998 RepID=A0A1I7UPM6_9PELO
MARQRKVFEKNGNAKAKSKSVKREQEDEWTPEYTARRFCFWFFVTSNVLLFGLFIDALVTAINEKNRLLENQS